MNKKEFIKTDRGWIDADTQEMYTYGSLALKRFNFNKKLKKKILGKLTDFFNVKKKIYTPDLITSSGKLVLEGGVKEYYAEPSLLVGRYDKIKITERELKIFDQDQNIYAIVLFPNNDVFYVVPDAAKPYSENYVYLPLLKDDALTLFNSLELEFILYYRKFANYDSLIDNISRKVLQGYEIRLVGADFYNSLVATYYNTLYVPLPSTIIWYDKHYHDKFTVSNIDEFYSLCGRDMIELINSQPLLTYCPICNNLFAKTDNRINFCPTCSADKRIKKKYNDSRRKSSPTQKEHKAIVDMLRNRNVDYNAFVSESYYYRDLIKGKNNAVGSLKYDSKINTEDKYLEWLKNKHLELQIRKKK